MTGRLVFFLLLPFFSWSQLESITGEWEKDTSLGSASVGFCIIDAKTGKTLAAYNAQKALVPASTLKVVTTTAALGILGGKFRYTTKLVHTGTFDKVTGIIAGDLIIVGSGDPSLQSEYFDSGKESISEKWAAVLKEKGVKGITGSIIADASCFERAVPDQWIWGDIGNYFGTTPCGLSYRDNKFQIYYRSLKSGSRALLVNVGQPYLKNKIEILSDVISKGTSDEAYVYGDPFGWKKFVSGSIPPNEKNYKVEAALPDPALLCAENLYSALIKAGVKCQSDVRTKYEKSDSASFTLLHTHYSPTLDQLIFHTNLKSNNLYCESFLLTLGKGNRYAGIAAVKNFWKTKGLNLNELFMNDGSGLSRSNAVTPRFLGEVLAITQRDSVAFKIINNSLPVAGKQGSMLSVGKGTVIEGKLRAKTGYISRVRAYAGYFTTASGKDLSFSVIFNNYNCSPAQARQKIEKFMVALNEL